MKGSISILPPMPTFRPDVREISPYVPGRPIADVAREHGFDPSEIVKLASNESPLPPFPEAQRVMAGLVVDSNRYPDDAARDLRHALADHFDVPADHLWVGGGSSELLRVVSTAVGGPGTSAVYPWPSFVIYRLGSIIAMADRIEVPLTSDHRLDLDAMLAAVRDDTTVVFVCNPNNPSGTVRPASELSAFIEAVPERVMVVVDEAYHEYATDPAHATALPHALERPNVLVTRTFSKIYGLAALRVGYGFGNPETLAELRKAQAPFTVTSLGQAGAIESLLHQGEVDRRAALNAEERARLEARFDELGIEHVRSQANFVYFRLGAGTAETTEAFVRHGIIIRPFDSGWVRVTVGTPEENRRFLAALEAELEGLAG